MVDNHVHGHGLKRYELRGVGDVVERVPGTQDAHTGCIGDNLLHLLDRRWPVELLRPVRVIAGPVLSWKMFLNHRFAFSGSTISGHPPHPCIPIPRGWVLGQPRQARLRLGRAAYAGRHRRAPGPRPRSSHLVKSQSAATRSNRTSRAPPLSRTRNNSSGGLVVEIGIPKTIYDLNNCTLAPSPSRKALNLTHMFAT